RYQGYNYDYAVMIESWPIYRDPGEPDTYYGENDAVPSLFLGTGSIAGINYNRWTAYYVRNSYAVNIEVNKNPYPRPSPPAPPPTRKGWSRGPELAKPAEAALVTEGTVYELYFLYDIDWMPDYPYYGRTQYAFHHLGNTT